MAKQAQLNSGFPYGFKQVVTQEPPIPFLVAASDYGRLFTKR
jgi:hypothetical protein